MLAIQDQTRSPRFMSFRSSTTFITVVVAYAVFTDQFLFAIIIPVAPFALHDRMNISEDKVQYWVALLIAVYGIACFVISPLWGWYSDQTRSRRTPWLLGLLLLLAATILLWLSRSIGLQLFARILQGMATTVIWTTGLAILVDTVGEEHIGEYMGYVGIALNLGTFIAPLIGGVLFARLGYNAVFYLIFGIIAIDVGLRLFMVEQHIASECHLLDPESAKTSISLEQNKQSNLKLTQLMIREDCSAYSRSSSPDSTMSNQERSRACNALPIVALLFSWRFLSALWGVFVLASVYSGLETSLPLAVHAKFGWSSTQGGLIFLPFMAPALFGPLVGRMSDRYGPRAIATSGFVLMLPSFVLLRVVQENTVEQKVLLCVLLALIGCSITLSLEPLMAEITHVARQHGAKGLYEVGEKRKGSYAQAYALFNMVWAAGGTAGPLWAGLMIESEGWKTMSWTFGLLGGLAALPTLLICGGWIYSGDDDQ